MLRSAGIKRKTCHSAHHSTCLGGTLTALAVAGLFATQLVLVGRTLSGQSEVRGPTCLLLDLQALNGWRKLAEDLVGLLVVLHLGSDELSEVAERLRGIQNLWKVSKSFAR